MKKKTRINSQSLQASSDDATFGNLGGVADPLEPTNSTRANFSAAFDDISS